MKYTSSELRNTNLPLLRRLQRKMNDSTIKEIIKDKEVKVLGEQLGKVKHKKTRLPLLDKRSMF